MRGVWNVNLIFLFADVATATTATRTHTSVLLTIVFYTQEQSFRGGEERSNTSCRCGGMHVKRVAMVTGHPSSPSLPLFAHFLGLFFILLRVMSAHSWEEVAVSWKRGTSAHHQPAWRCTSLKNGNTRLYCLPVREKQSLFQRHIIYVIFYFF